MRKNERKIRKNWLPAILVQGYDYQKKSQTWRSQSTVSKKNKVKKRHKSKIKKFFVRR